MDLARGRLSRRVRTDGPEEVAALATSFNEMAAELERQQALRQSLVHDVAHELRTPLTALQCRLEAAIDGLAATLWDRSAPCTSKCCTSPSWWTICRISRSPRRASCGCSPSPCAWPIW